MTSIKILTSFTALLCICTTTQSLKGQTTFIDDIVLSEFDCATTINDVNKSWKPVKDSVFRYAPFSIRNKGLNAAFLNQLASLTECCCPASLASIDSINKKFPKPDVTIKTDSLIKQYYFFRSKEYCQYRSKKLKLSDNIPYTIILIFNIKTSLLIDVITN
ncbi:MAG: hypothetical protein KF706_11080 [Chitinophagales bacterium]|nr:hypothetical protein [Chitinophagales bacterium]HRN94971.1 hypothetical protein [Chitinophagales bacterium]HRP39263.1 hypothetical protein [Chitinophagales bacterium]